MHARCPDVDRGGTGPRPGLELADILRRHLDGYRQSHALSLSGQAVLRDLMSCRTAALGGHMDTCTACGFERPSYNSCRNRHCPKCQALAQARWVEARLDRILRVPHFHLVFTLPSDLRQLCRQSPAVMFDILLKAAAASIATLARDPKWLGAKVQPGVTAVLHTWTRQLEFHPHAHCIVTGGGFALDGSRRVAAKPDFLFPVRVLGALFRGKFLAALENAIRDGALRDDLSDRAARRRNLSRGVTAAACATVAEFLALFAQFRRPRVEPNRGRSAEAIDCGRLPGVIPYSRKELEDELPGSRTKPRLRRSCGRRSRADRA